MRHIVHHILHSTSTFIAGLNAKSHNRLISNLFYVVPIIFSSVLYIADVVSDVALTYQYLAGTQGQGTQGLGYVCFTFILLSWFLNVCYAVKSLGAKRLVSAVDDSLSKTLLCNFFID